MTPLTLYVFDTGSEPVAVATRDELLTRHGWVDVETVGPLLVWPSTYAGAVSSALVVSSVARVMRLLHDPTLAARREPPPNPGETQ